MKKKIILIVLGSLCAIVALLAVLFYVKGPFVGFPGSRTADGSRAVSDGGDPAVVGVAAAVKDRAADARLAGPLGNQRADLL